MVYSQKGPAGPCSVSEGLMCAWPWMGGGCSLLPGPPFAFKPDLEAWEWSASPDWKPLRQGRAGPTCPKDLTQAQAQSWPW